MKDCKRLSRYPTPAPEWSYSALFRLWGESIYWSVSSLFAVFCCVQYFCFDHPFHEGHMSKLWKIMVVFCCTSGRSIWKTKALLSICACTNCRPSQLWNPNAAPAEAPKGLNVIIHFMQFIHKPHTYLTTHDTHLSNLFLLSFSSSQLTTH